jgi:ribosome-associated protein
MEVPQDTGWMVVDAFDVMVHLFTADQRERYALENLWKDAVEVSVTKLLSVAKPTRTKPATKKKAAIVKRVATAKRKKSV